MASKKKSSKSKPTKKSVKAPKDRYFKHPKFLKEWHKTLLTHRWLRGGILALILVSLAAGLMVLGFRILEPPPLSKLLPANTVHYTEYTPQIIEAPIAPGLGSLAGEAFWENSETPQLRFYFVEDPVLVESELASEQAIQHSKLVGDYFVIGDSQASLDILERVKNRAIPSLHLSDGFMALRPHLSYQSERFDYHTAAFTLGETHYEWLGTPIAPRREWLDSPLNELFTEVFTPTGVSNEFQSYTVGDKTFMDGQPLFHFDTKYKGDLLALLPESVEKLTAGQNFTTLKTQFIALLNQADNVSATILEGLLTDRLHKIFTEKITLKDDILPLFSSEYALARTPDGGWILLLELTENSFGYVDVLLQSLVANGISEQQSATGRLRNLSLEIIPADYQDQTYHQLQQSNGKNLFSYQLHDNLLMLATDVSDMEQMLEVSQGKATPYTATPIYDKIKPLIEGSDHLHITPGYILGFNGFDDGFITTQP